MSPSLRCPGPSLICFEVMLYGQAWRTPFGFNELETLNSRPTNGVRSQYVRRSVESGRLNNGPIDGQCICVLFWSCFLIFAINRRKPGASTKRTRTMRMLFNFLPAPLQTNVQQCVPSRVNSRPSRLCFCHVLSGCGWRCATIVCVCLHTMIVPSESVRRLMPMWLGMGRTTPGSVGIKSAENECLRIRWSRHARLQNAAVWVVLLLMLHFFGGATQRWPH